MGTDICMKVEVKNNGTWQPIDEIFKNEWYDNTRELSDWNKPLTDKPYDGRNYDLFAILADVRNGRGFGGCLTGEGFNIISEPKGFPCDMSYSEEDFYGGHSASYLNLKELKDFNWNQTVCHYGVISEEEYIKFKNTKENPNSWSGGISGQKIITVDETTMDKILNKTLDRNNDLRYYIQCKFNPITYYDCCSNFMKNTIPQLQSLIPNGGTEEDVRIIFDFDC